MHISVLQKEIIEILSLKSGQKFIDATAGAGGHSLAILERIMPNGKLLVIDLDKDALARVAKRIEVARPDLKNNLILVNGNFSDLGKIARVNGFLKVDGIIADLGFSSDQLEQSGRGFTFQKDEPLDMRYNISQLLTAREIINQWPEEKIIEVLKNYSEERFADRIAGEIIKSRQVKPIITTFELIAAIARAVPKFYQHGRIHFATKTFQSLRIAVNDELGNLERFLDSSFRLLGGGGRLAIISFHSLEDRIVKNFFRRLKQEKSAEVLTKKPVIPSVEEIKINLRSRSAKLRAIKKL
jgi:16S rRNA (cytosine1402-N4)-methyltransferase